MRMKTCRGTILNAGRKIIPCAVVLAGMAGGLLLTAPSAQASPQDSMPGMKMDGSGKVNGPANMEMAHMPGHMTMTSLRPLQPGDRQKADAVVAAAHQVMAHYRDYHQALNDGYKIFMPGLPQRQYHFTNYKNAREAAFHFDPAKPTSLLYRKTADGGYQLIGVMYTDRKSASEDDLNRRIPLSIARWHQHTNFCKAPKGEEAEYSGPDAKFGLRGSITTEQACEAAGGKFYPHVFGWMVHVYADETDPAKIWSTGNNGDGHDNMDHSAMVGGAGN